MLITVGVFVCGVQLQRILGGPDVPLQVQADKQVANHSGFR